MQKSLENYLEATVGAGKVLAHARLLIKLANLYQKIAPAHLSQASTLANYKSGIIVIHATTGAVAAKLRQLAPSLSDGFSKRGIECNGVQVKVQAQKSSMQSISSAQKPLTAPSRLALQELCDTLPDSELKLAIGTLIRRSA